MAQTGNLVVLYPTAPAESFNIDELNAAITSQGTILTHGTEVELLECGAGGHRIAAPVTYHDGLIAGSCERCQARFEMPWLPGGTAAAKVMALAETILAVLDTGCDVPDHVISDFLSAQAQARADRELLDDALELGGTVNKVIARQLLG